MPFVGAAPGAGGLGVAPRASGLRILRVEAAVLMVAGLLVWGCPVGCFGSR
ncbi:hypothetical protein ACQ86N_31075 [Puia sp. P3]|uniref:hypothetical protein n=1 Tax=Puia sp. P3 TaxID=3423952 RepID=UPI003D67F7E5